MAMRSFVNKIGVITGGASGIGLALCQRLHASGAYVVIADLDVAAGQRAAAALQGPPGSEYAQLDVCDSQAVDALVAAVVARHGRLDFFINNAGIEISGEVADLSAAHWQKTLAVNLHGVVNGSVAAYRQMVKQKAGTLVNVASGAGLIMFPTSIPYTTAKAGVVGLTRALRAEGADLGVEVILVCPGMVDTPIFDKAISIGPNIRDFAAHLPGNMLSAERAAKIIAAGMLAGKGEIIFPLSNAIGARLIAALPALGDWLRRDIVRKFRTLKQKA